MGVITEERTLSKPEGQTVPEHIAIIMDGNRRWAERRGLPWYMGHRKGAGTVDKIVRSAVNLGVKVLTLFAFSTENWNRSPKEVSEILGLFFSYLHNRKKQLIREGIRLRTIGDIAKFPKALFAKIQEVVQATENCSTIDLVLALNYGARDEITRAVNKIIDDFASNKMQKQEVTENLISSYLDTSSWQDPDLLIRTSGEKRLSNFLLWQMSYAEVYTTDVLWPDFDRDCLLEAIKEYQQRERRFGE